MVSIIIPVFNNYQYTQICLEAIFKNSSKEIDYEIIIVDNHSTDETFDKLTELQNRETRVRYFRLDKNYKFGAACNYGAEKAKGEFLVFLNNDTEPQEGWLVNAINRFRSNEKIGIVGSKLLYPDGTIQHCGIKFYNNVNPDYKGWPLHRYMNQPSDYPPANKPEIVRAVTGACLFIRKHLFVLAEGFDTGYEMYFEDTDLNFKVRNLGYEIFYEPTSVVIHYEGKSSPNQELIDSMNAESAKRFYKKWAKELVIVEAIDEYIVEVDGNITVLSEDVYPENLITYSVGKAPLINIELFKEFFQRLLVLGKAYYHFGGAGDALLFLSTFYDENPEQIVVSFCNSVPALKSFFKSFPELKKVYLIRNPVDSLIHSNLRKFLPSFSNVLGMGATPTKPYEYEWFEGIDIFAKYGIKRKPKWIEDFRKIHKDEYEVVIAPKGSVVGMHLSKKNIIDPKIWAKLIGYLNSLGIKPVLIGTPDEEDLYPVVGECINKRSYSFYEQMQIISQSRILIGADSWAKTFSALAGMPTIVFEPMKGKDLEGWKDSSDFVFIEPWKEITVVKDYEQFVDAFRENYFHKEINESKENVIQTESAPQEIKPKSEFQLIWHSSVYDNSGYADEARNFLTSFNELGVDIKLNQVSRGRSATKLSSSMLTVLDYLCDRRVDFEKYKINISHSFPSAFFRVEGAYNIGRTMYGNDTLPDGWKEKCSEMDEIWVPSEYNINTFVNAGIDRNKLHKIPSGVNTELFQPEGDCIEEIKSIEGIKFLSVFDWTLRKGWDVLIKAFLKEFGANTKYKLVLKVWSSYGKTIDDIKKQALAFIKANHLGKSLPKNLIFYDKQIVPERMPALYRSVDAYVSSSRGESTGRALMEAMAVGLPVIATGCTGQLEFMNDENSFLIDNELKPVSREAIAELNILQGHLWYEPSERHLRKLMKQVIDDKENAQKKAIVASANIRDNFNLDSAVKNIKQRLEHIYHHQNELNNKPCIRWEGTFDNSSSLSIVNNGMISGLDLSRVKVDKLDSKQQKKIASKKSVREADDGNEIINVQHFWPPDLTPPQKGHWVIIQPWEFGSLPSEWIDTFNNKVDEFWVPSSYVRDVFIDSGVKKDKVFVIPNGFDPAIYNKDVEPFRLKTKKKFKFLFVGGTIYRKGIDILLETYLKTFTSKDDVCLVIKDMGGDSFYAGMNFKKKIQDIQKKKDSPEIEYIDSFLKVEELARLYKACDVLVHPYRGEGFGLPILESMACGTPAIVTNGGACLDFCNHENSFLVDAQKIAFSKKKVGDYNTVKFPWLWEVGADELQSKMQYVLDNKEIIEEKGEKACKFVHENFTWRHASNEIMARIPLLVSKGIVREQVDLSGLSSVMLQVDRFIREKKYNEALEKLDDAIDEFSGVSNSNTGEVSLYDLLKIAGEISSYLKLYDRSNEYFSKILESFPDSGEICFNIAQNFSELNNFKAAKTMYEWAIKNGENNKEVWAKLKNVNLKLNFDEDHNTLDLREPEAKPTFADAEKLVQKQDYQGAKNILNVLIKDDPENVDILNGLAFVYLVENNFVESLKYLEKVLTLDPQNEIALGNLQFIEKKSIKS